MIELNLEPGTYEYKYVIINIIERFKKTRSCAALRAADLDWIVGPEYSLGGYIITTLDGAGGAGQE